MVEHRPFIELGVAGHGLRHLHREAAREYPDTPEDGLLGVVEQVVAPLQRSAQGLVPAQGGARTPSEQLEARIELVAHGAQAERGYSCRCQLDGERQAVEPAADVDDERHALVVQREMRVHRPHAGLEQGHRAELARAARRRLGRHGQRYEPVLLLGRQVQRFLAGRQHRDVRRLPHDGLHQRRDRIEKVLAVVEHQQRSPRRHGGDQLVLRRTSPCQCDAERLRDAVGQQQGIGQTGQLDHPRAVRPAAGHCVRRRLRQAALADAARTHHGNELVRID